MKGLARLKHYYRTWNDYIDPKAVILMYHRVAELVDYSYQISVTPNHFRQHMAYLKDAYNPMTLDEMAEAVARGSIPRRAIAITFDDGYADNYLNALSILEESQIPATIFVSTGYVNTDREYWWDDLERIFLSTDRIPERLDSCFLGQEYSWDLDSIEKRKSTLKEVHRLTKPLYPDEREKFLETLAKWAGLGRHGRKEHRSLTWDELRRLANSPWIQIGGHTVNHPQLSALSVMVQRQEIVQGRVELEKAIGKSIMTFSYPFGGRGDFSLDTVAAVKEAGFKVACSTEHARVARGADLYRLPRYWVGDWGIEEFQKQVANFFQR